jgi:hypothetical protein
MRSWWHWSGRHANADLPIGQCELGNLAKWSWQNEQVKSTRQNSQIAMWTFGFGQMDLQHGTIELGKIGKANIPISFLRMGALNWFWWISCVHAAPKFLAWKECHLYVSVWLFFLPKEVVLLKSQITLFSLPHYGKFSLMKLFIRGKQTTPHL